MPKNRHYINASSLGSYFGVGFLSPNEQFEVDKGDSEQVFDDDAQDRLNLGKFLENASLDFFEDKLGIAIHSRNVEVVEFYDGKIRGKFDGIAELNGLPTVVENKISNAYDRFTEKPGYLFQVQAYMMSENFEQALLCGLFNGKPIYKIIERDEEMIEDIKEMADFVTDALLGITDFEENFPHHLYEKYTNRSKAPVVKNLSNEHMMYFQRLGQLNKEKKAIEDEIKKLKESIDDIGKMNDMIFEDDFMKVTVTSFETRGHIDYDTLSIEHADIDFEKYRLPARTSQRVTVKLKD